MTSSATIESSRCLPTSSASLRIATSSRVKFDPEKMWTHAGLPKQMPDARYSGEVTQIEKLSGLIEEWKAWRSVLQSASQIFDH